MNKLPLIIKREYLAKVRNKSFIVMTFLSPILIVGIALLISYLTQLNNSEKKVIAVLNESSYFSDDFVTTSETTFVMFKSMTLDEAKVATKNLDHYGLLYIPNDTTLQLISENAYFYSKESPGALTLRGVENIFENQVRKQKLLNFGISPSNFEEINSTYQIKLSTFDGEENVLGIGEIKAIIGGAFGYLIMMFIVIYGGFVMRSVIEEKTSRIVEIIISSVKPFELMMGKIIGTSLAGITQFAIWIGASAILFLIFMLIFDLDTSVFIDGGLGEVMEQGTDLSLDQKNALQLYTKEIFDIPWFLLINFFLVYFILGYFIYSSIYAAIGASVDNETDTQQFIFPIILPLMLAMYVGFFSVLSNPHGPIAVGFSLFPLTSPIVMMMRLPGGIGDGGVAYWQLFLSIIILLLTFISIVWLAAKIYRVGILMYGKKPTYKDLFKWLKY